MDARNGLASDNYKLVNWVLHRLLNKGYFYLIEHNQTSKEDLFSAGCLGLAKAISRYKPEKGKFSTFAVPHISGNIQHYIRDHCQTAGIKVPRVDIENKDFPKAWVRNHLKGDEHEEFIFERYNCLFELNRKDREILEDLLSGLESRDAELIRKVWIEGYSQREAAKSLGYCSATATRRLKKSLAQLQQLAKENS